MAVVLESDKALLKEFLTEHPKGTFTGFKEWMKTKDPNHSLEFSFSDSYIYCFRDKLMPKAIAEATLAAKPKRKYKRRQKLKVERQKRDHRSRVPKNVIDINELRRKLVESDISVEEHKLVNETGEKMKLLDPALSDLHIWFAPDGRVCFTLTRVKVVSFVG